MNVEDFKRAFAGEVPVPPPAVVQKKEEIIPEVKVNPSDILTRPQNPSVMANNPLVSKLRRIPGETFRLPSKGAFYVNEELHPNVVNGELLVYPMTGYDELLFKSYDAVFQGTAIENVIRRCVPGVLKPMELTTNDIDFLLTCIRKVTYGDTISVRYKCNSEKCLKNPDAQEHSYDVYLSTFIQKSKEISESQIKELTFVLGNIFSITLRPIKTRDMLEIRRNLLINETDTTKSLTNAHANNIKFVQSTIQNVDGITDPEIIVEWLKELPANLFAEMIDNFERLNGWGVQFTYSLKCKDCGENINISTPMNPLYFFTKPSDLMIE